MTDAYSVLGLKKGASKEDVFKAYKQKALKAHPDKGGSSEEFKKVMDARDTLLKQINDGISQSQNGTAFGSMFGASCHFNHGMPFGHQQTTPQPPPQTASPPQFGNLFGQFMPQFWNPQNGSAFFTPQHMDQLRKQFGSTGQSFVPPKGTYVFNGRYLSPKSQKEYINVKTNRVISNLKKPGFTYLDVSKTGKGPFFCGLKADMIEFCKINKIA